MSRSSVCDDAGFGLFALLLPIEPFGQLALARFSGLVSDFLWLIVFTCVLAQLFQHLSDHELIKACSDPSPHWDGLWKEFDRRFGRFILSTINAELQKQWPSAQILEHKEAVKDIQQDVYLKLLRRRGKALKDFRGNHPESFKAYLRVITIHLTRNFSNAERMKKKYIPGRVSVTGSYDAKEKEQFCDSSEYVMDASKFMRYVIETLEENYISRNKERDITIFKLYFFDGRPSTEIQLIVDPNLTHLSVSGVETVISRTKQTLQKILLE